MKRFLIMICAVAAAVCSCDKYGDTIDELNKKLDGVEATQAELLNKVEAMQALANAKAAETTISSIATTADGLKVCFSDGKQFIIADGANGKDGAKGNDGKDGEDKIKVTEDETSFTFDFGNGDVITVAKTFTIIFDEDAIECPAGSTCVIKYEISGGDETVTVLAKPIDGCKIVSVDEEACKITVIAAGRQGEHFVSVRAIRNSDGKVAEKLATIVAGPRAPIALDGAMTGYYGEEWDGSDLYYTQFYKGEVDENNYFVGEAYSLLFEFYAPISDVMALPAGMYEAGIDHAAFTFTQGTNITLRESLEEELWIYQLFYGISTVEELAEMLGYSVDDLDVLSYGTGAELYHQFDDESAEDYGITEGTVEIALNGTKYTVTMNLVTIDDEWIFTYEGEIEHEDHRHILNNVDVYNWGDYFSEDTTDWILEISDTNNPSDGTYIIEFLGEAGQTELPEGVFEVSSDFAPNTVLAGEDYSYWYRSGIVWDAADSGCLYIEKTEKGYLIQGEFEDEWYEEDWSFSYEGPVNYDISGEFETPRHGKSIHDITVNTRESIVKAEPDVMLQRINAYKSKKAGMSGRIPWFNHK
ncbi:MAG: hypothetical protein MJY73_00835 [Bacteroidales bacterium]|nr:hypothetical protein [Bacteroidales bacterium]